MAHYHGRRNVLQFCRRTAFWAKKHLDYLGSLPLHFGGAFFCFFGVCAFLALFFFLSLSLSLSFFCFGSPSVRWGNFWLFFLFFYFGLLRTIRTRYIFGKTGRVYSHEIVTWTLLYGVVGRCEAQQNMHPLEEVRLGLSERKQKRSA